jgi:hypothetical protein
LFVLLITAWHALFPVEWCSVCGPSPTLTSQSSKCWTSNLPLIESFILKYYDFPFIQNQYRPAGVPIGKLMEIGKPNYFLLFPE